MAVNQAETIDNKLIKQVEETSKYKSRFSTLRQTVKQLDSKIKKQKRMKADKNLFKKLDEVDDLAGKEKLHKLSAEALANFKADFKDLTFVVEKITGWHKFLHEVINKEATPLAENLKRLHDAQVEREKKKK